MSCTGAQCRGPAKKCHGPSEAPLLTAARGGQPPLQRLARLLSAPHPSSAREESPPPRGCQLEAGLWRALLCLPKVADVSASPLGRVRFCGLAMIETKGPAEIVTRELQKRVTVPKALRIHWTGCPNSCGQV